MNVFDEKPRRAIFESSGPAGWMLLHAPFITGEGDWLLNEERGAR